jgi:hypothetical protein
VQNVLHDQQHQGSQRSGRHAHQHDEAEAEREHEQEIDVAAGDDLVNGDLHVEGPRQDQDLQNDREHKDL